MTRKYLVSKICPIECTNDDICYTHGCSDICIPKLNKMLDEYDKQIREDAIDEYKKKIEFVEEWLFDCKVDDPNVIVAFETLKHYGEHMQKGAKE